MKHTRRLWRYFFFAALFACVFLLPDRQREAFATGVTSPFFAGSLADTPTFAGLADDFTAKESFVSHLPILVLEQKTDGLSSGGRAQLSLYAGAGGENSLRDTPSVTVGVSVRTEGPLGLLDASGKQSLLLELVPSHLSDPDAQKISLAGLPADNAWRLQGSSRDKGMLRSGLAYGLGRELFPDHTPEIRYCEVFFKRNNSLRYQGLFILTESLAHLFEAGHTGGDKILLQYSPGNETGRGRNAGSGDDDAIFGRSLADRGFSTVYPEGGDGILASRMEAAIDNLENSLRSLKPTTFLEYRSQVNEDSLVDLFILNSLLLNAHASRVSFYLAPDAKGRLRVLPRWEFDAAIDNSPIRPRPLPFEVEAPQIPPMPILARRVPVWNQLEGGKSIRDLRLYPVYDIMDGNSFLWFDRLFLSRPFLTDLFSRYHELRRGPFSPRNVSAQVDALAAHLGHALERDWKRWEKEYTGTEGPWALLPYTDSEGGALIRQTSSYRQELVKIRYSLLMQDDFLMSQITQLDWLSTDLFDEATSGNDRAGLALLMIVGFLLLTHMLTRKL